MTQPKAPAKPDPKTEHREEEVHSGSNAFGFFHRHQKLIIYTAGIFTLLTFSITGALLGTFDYMFRRDMKRPEMEVPGIGKVKVTEEDVEAAKGISQVRNNPLRLVAFPQLQVSRDEDSNSYIDQLSTLHAIAVKLGIDASEDDVDAVLQAAVRTYPEITNPQQLAYNARGDLALFRKWLRSTIRVATLVRLAGLGVAQTDAEAIAEIIDDNERVAFQAAFIDTKGFKTKLEKDLTDDILKKYLEDLDDLKAENYRKPANRSAIKVAMLAADAFEHAEYLGVEIEKDTKIGENEVQDRYIRDRDERYKVPKPETPKKDGDKDQEAADKKPEDAGKKPEDAGKKPEDSGKKPDAAGSKDAGKKEEAADEGNGNADPLPQGQPEQEPTKQDPPPAQDPAKAKQDQPKQDPPPLIGADGTKPQAGDTPPPPSVTQDQPGQVEQQEYKPLDEALRKKIAEQLYAEIVLARWQAELDKEMAKHMEDVINARTAAEIAVEDAKEELAEAEIELEKNKDEAKKAALEKKVADLKKKVELTETAAKASKEAVDARRKAFDFEGVVKRLAKGRKGLRIVTIAEMKDAEGLREHPELGKWKDSQLPGQMSLAGAIHNGAVQSTDKGAFIFQVTDIEERPFQDFKDIKERLQTDYLQSKAEKYTKDRKEAFEKALEKLAREKLKEEIAKIEKDGTDDADKQFADWKSALEEKIVADEKLLATMDSSMRAYKGIAGRRDVAKAELEKADEKKQSIKEAVDKQTEEKVDEKLAEVHKDVLAEAGKIANLTVEEVGPFSRKLKERPRFDHRYSNVVQAIYGDSDIAEFDVDDTTTLKEDSLNEVTFMAVCTKVEEASAEQISRRQWLATKQGSDYLGSFAGQRMQEALDQSFTIEAMKIGFKWVPPQMDDEKEKGPAKQGSDEKDKKKG